MMCSADDRASRNSSRLFAYACGIRRTFFEGSNDHASRDSSDPFAYACGIRRTFRFCHACSANIEHGVLTLLFRENLVHILWTFCAREKISFTYFGLFALARKSRSHTLDFLRSRENLVHSRKRKTHDVLCEGCMQSHAIRFLADTSVDILPFPNP